VFNIGPFEVLVLAIVGLIVLGPDRLPGLARDAARMLRTLREMATGARAQLREELGPEFADIDLRTLNPRTAVQRAVFGDDVPDLTKYDPRRLNPGAAVRDAIFGADEADKPVSMTKQPAGSGTGSVSAANGSTPAANGSTPAANGSTPAANGARPRPRPRPRVSYDDDAT
jgi:sec-independent protein translocase protein TatB